jgi:hypothetical protein
LKRALLSVAHLEEIVRLCEADQSNQMVNLGLLEVDPKLLKVDPETGKAHSRIDAGTVESSPVAWEKGICTVSSIGRASDS